MQEVPRAPISGRVLAVVLIVAVMGCERIPGLDDRDAAAPDADVVLPPEPETLETPPSEPLPDRIYFTLTDYEWYARGQPLVHANAQYRAGSGVVAAPLSSMRKVGEYEGVDVYAADGAAVDTAVYVPVFPGYWQPFHLSQAAVPAATGS
jgi:hypothetical protein